MRKAVGDRSITDMEDGADITLPKRDVAEPTFGHAPAAAELVHPGNEEYIRGDRIQRPQGGAAAAPAAAAPRRTGRAKTTSSSGSRAKSS